MKEKDLQDWLTSLIKDDSLLDHVLGQEQLRAAYAKAKGEHSLAAFLTDYRFRKRMLESSVRVLDVLYGLSLIQDVKNMSLHKGDRLYPDIVTANAESGHFVVFELKTGRSSAREALTELLAYDHLLRNHLPLLSDAHVHLVVVAQDFPPLLDQAVANAVLWQDRSILCLRPNAIANPTALEIHTPRGWWAMGQQGLPDEALLVASLSVERMDTKDYNEDQIERLYMQAVEIVRHRGSRNGSHGIVTLVKDTWGLAESKWVLLVGYINPFHLFRMADQAGFVEGPGTPLVEFLRDEDNSLSMESQMVPVIDAIKEARELLKCLGTPIVEGDYPWRTTRHQWKHRGVVQTVESWGFIGDHIIGTWLSPKYRDVYNPIIGAKALPWSMPQVSIPMLDGLADLTCFKQARLDARTVVGLGIKLGYCHAVAANIASRTKHPDSDAAVLQWAELDVLPEVLELANVLTEEKRATMPKATFSGGVIEYSGKVAEWVTAMITWIADELIGENHPVHRALFAAAINGCYLFDEYLETALKDKTVRRNVSNELMEQTRPVISACLQMLFTSGSFHDDMESIKRHLIDDLGMDQKKLNAKDIKKALQEVPDDKLITCFPTILPEIVDGVLPAVILPTAETSMSDVDWSWIKDQVLAADARGEKYPVVCIAANGEWGVGVVPEHRAYSITSKLNHEEEVWVAISKPGVAEIFLRKKWDDLEREGLGEEQSLRKTE
jgi:hypothetical protein